MKVSAPLLTAHFVGQLPWVYSQACKTETPSLFVQSVADVSGVASRVCTGEGSASWEMC